jgi:bacteriocin biosynthesis cyclodehydratase domain-containing protein
VRTKASPRVRRPVLRPGFHVLRRSATELQVGLDPERAVVLPDRPAVRAQLEALRSPARPAGEPAYDGRTLDLLARSGLLVDADVLLPLAPDPPSGHDTAGVSRADVAAIAAHSGDGVAGLMAARSAARVDLVSCGSAEAVTVTAALRRLLTAAGLRARVLPHATPPEKPDGDRPDDGHHAGALVAVGEPDREQLDAWMRAGVPHLLLRISEGHALIGPFVLPGQTACLRCLDAHHTDVDPAWPLLVTQQATAVTRVREDTVPEPVDVLLATLAASWVARDLVSHVEGRPPSTTSTTIHLDPHLTALETHCWPRHPACGCAWE